jgi:cellulose synthase/poly-beta-1,6-N-acetylglucosamine synthase-like glycosyltransferase
MTSISLLLAVPLILLNLYFALEVFLGLKAGSKSQAAKGGARLTIIMPAHDEAAIISTTVAALLHEMGEGDLLLVVADNCEDDTAALARAAGAEVIERSDATRRGKGYALAYARDALAQSPPPCVAVIDADCATDGASIRALAQSAMQTGRPVQAVNLLRPTLAADPMVQVSNFAFVVKNLVRQRGLERISGAVHLTGTGMAFPWALFEQAPLATADIVEDLNLGIDMVLRGHPPLLEPRATVWSSSSGRAATLTQRTRWEGGFLSTALKRAAPLLANAVRLKSATQLWLGISLAVPPLALLVLFNFLIGAALGVLLWLGSDALPVTVLALSAFAIAVAVGLAWLAAGRDFLSARAATRLPLYLFWKIPLYVGLLRARPTSWLRTGR